jgi:predicted CXXCH cytochrome family protein
MNHPVSGKNTLQPESEDISCTSCHSPHGFNQGKKMLKMPGNALCVSCHGDASKPSATGKTMEVKR